MKRQSYLIFLAFASLFFSCGGGGTIGTVCDAAATKLFQECDPQSTADQQTIWNALQGMGISISFAEIENYTEDRARSDCEEGLGSNENLTITDEQAQDFVDSLNGLNSCETVVDAIRLGIASL